MYYSDRWKKRSMTSNRMVREKNGKHRGSDKCDTERYAKDLMTMDIGPTWESKVREFFEYCMKSKKDVQTRNQIRKFYDYILEIDRLLRKGDYKSIKKTLIKAKINILYAANRLNRDYIKNLHTFYSELLNRIDFDKIENEKEKLERLVTIFEAIVAYSRG